jgi:hypothetical protein
MIHRVRGWLVAAALAGLAVLHTEAARAADPPFATGQPQVEAPSPTPPADVGSETLPSPTPVPPPQQPAYVLPPPDWPIFDFSKRDPLLDRPDAPQPGWYADVQTSILALHLRNQLNNPVQNTLTGNMDTVAFAGNRLDPTVSPRFEVGYRLPNGWGSLQLGYRFLVSQGGTLHLFNQMPATVQGGFDYNMIDLTYVSREFSLGPLWEMRWGVGLRSLFLYFDANLAVLNPASDPGTVLGQRETNHDKAIGAWAFLDLSRRVSSIPGLAFFGRMEGTDMLSRIKQTAAETVANGAGVEPLVFDTRFDNSVGLNILAGVAGLSYTVPQWNYSRFMAGYQYETYFQIGRIQNSRAQLDVQGLFLRAEFNF